MNADNNPLSVLLNLLSIKHTKHFARSISDGFPYINSLAGLKSAFKNHYNTESIAVKVQKEDLDKIDVPFVAQLDIAGSRLVVVTKSAEKRVTYIYKGEQYITPLQLFNEKWNGVVLLVSPDDNSIEENYRYNRVVELLGKIRIPFVLTVLVLSIFYFTYPGVLIQIDQGAFYLVYMFLFYSAGIALSISLLMISSNRSNRFIQKFCKLAGKSGCNEILESNAASVFGLVSWSEIGFIYFAGTLLIFLIVPNAQPLLFLISVLPLPYTLWSIYYQYRVARKWCMICVSIQCIFWCLFAIQYNNIPVAAININSSMVITGFVCYMMAAAGLWLVVPYINSHEEINTLERDLRKLKFSPEIWKFAMKGSNRIDTTNASDIILGNPSAPLRITVITDPFCPHCKKAHTAIKKAFADNRDKICIQLVFPEQKETESMNAEMLAVLRKKKRVLDFLMAVYFHDGSIQGEEKINECYESRGRDFEKTMRHFTLPESSDLIIQQYRKQQEWLSHVRFLGPPKIYINGNELPPLYGIEDLRHLVYVAI